MKLTNIANGAKTIALQTRAILMSATFDASQFSNPLKLVIMGFAAILILRGLAAVAEGQAEQNAGAKTQGYGLIGGGLVLGVAGTAVINIITTMK